MGEGGRWRWENKLRLSPGETPGEGRRGGLALPISARYATQRVTECLSGLRATGLRSTISIPNGCCGVDFALASAIGSGMTET